MCSMHSTLLKMQINLLLVTFLFSNIIICKPCMLLNFMHKWLYSFAILKKLTVTNTTLEVPIVFANLYNTISQLCVQKLCQSVKGNVFCVSFATNWLDFHLNELEGNVFTIKAYSILVSILMIKKNVGTTLIPPSTSITNNIYCTIFTPLVIVIIFCCKICTAVVCKWITYRATIS